MSHYQSLLVDRDERIGIVTLNRPKELNALNFQLVSELANALEELDRDEEILCMVITGAGEKAFAAGADVKEMSEKSPIEMMLGGFQNWEGIRRIHKPLIAAVGGYALGGGCELAMQCDMIVASENARFGQPEINLGIIPGVGGTQRLARTLGKYRTMEMVLTGVQVTAQEMADQGLVNRVVPMASLMDTAMEYAREIANNAPLAVQATKEMALRSRDMDLPTGLRMEQAINRILQSSEDVKEGVAAFAEKRPARFRGR